MLCFILASRGRLRTANRVIVAVQSFKAMSCPPSLYHSELFFLLPKPRRALCSCRPLCLSAAAPPHLLQRRAASPTHVTLTSERCATEQQCPNGFTATLTLINNPDVKVDSFVLSPPSPGGRTPPSSLEESRIRSNVVRALEWSAPDTGEGATTTTCPMARERDMFDVVCMAFGADARVELELDEEDNDSCISQLHRLNRLLRESDDSVSSASSRASTHPGVSRCPLVASVMSGRKGGVFVSRRDEESGECSAAAGSVVGAVLSGRRESLTSFQLVHAGKHLALRGSQFEIKHMKDGKIAEVVPVLTMESASPSASAAAATAGGPASDDPSSWPRPRCHGGSVSAAEWCQQVVASSTLFEKLAMQSALGVGVLKRVAGGDDPCRDGSSGSDRLCGGGFAAPPVGVLPCLPAQSCLDVQEVELDGSLRLAQKPPQGDLREGDLCDFRAVGTLASLQAEQDAYTWLHASRMSSAMRHMRDERDQGPTHSTVVQGCLTASTRARFPGGLEGEGCQEMVRSASGPGGCPTVGSVSDFQLVSVDNTMVTCSSLTGLAEVYLCGGVREYEQ